MPALCKAEELLRSSAIMSTASSSLTELLELQAEGPSACVRISAISFQDFRFHPGAWLWKGSARESFLAIKRGALGSVWLKERNAATDYVVKVVPPANIGYFGCFRWLDYCCFGSLFS